MKKKILLAVDGSDNSLRAVRHATKILSPVPDLELTMFHVVPHLRHYFSVGFEKENPQLQAFLNRQDQKRMEEFNNQVRTIFDSAHFQPSQLKMKTNTASYDVSTAILDEMRTGLYGTLLVCRRGERGAFFVGRTCLRLIQKIEDQSI
jgi:hypothetical protein